ncbi:hypothetical protein DJ55_4160 [Yersinia pseudotuberculosis]|nr:hypothetical protein DJ55_4160 [Yersinia pseudotuberculosis]
MVKYHLHHRCLAVSLVSLVLSAEPGGTLRRQGIRPLHGPNLWGNDKGRAYR